MSEAMVMVNIVNGVNRVIIRETIVETEIMVIQVRVEHNMLERLPSLIRALTVMSFEVRSRLRHLLPSL